MQKPLVQLRNLTKRVGRKTVVQDVTLDVSAWEVFGLLGSAGSGRLTIAGLITGMIKSTSGQVVIDGHDLMRDRKRALRKIGAVVAFPDLYPFLTGYDNLLHFARLSSGVTTARIQEVVERVGAAAYVHKKVKTYAAAHMQRLALAQALLHEPSVLVIEPIGADMDDLGEYVQLLRTLADQEGMAVIITSETLSHMERVCDRVGIIHEGRLVSIRDQRDSKQHNDGGERIG